MKKWVFFALVSILAVSCASTPAKTAESYAVDIQGGAPGITVSMSNISWQSAWEGWAGLRGVELNIVNNSDSAIRVDWGKSSVNYAGSSYGVFLDGQKYIDAGKAPPASVVPAKGSLKKFVYSSAQPYFISGYSWKMHPLEAPLQVLLCTVSGNAENYTTISISEK